MYNVEDNMKNINLNIVGVYYNFLYESLKYKKFFSSRIAFEFYRNFINKYESHFVHFYK